MLGIVYTPNPGTTHATTTGPVLLLGRPRSNAVRSFVFGRRPLSVFSSRARSSSSYARQAQLFLVVKPFLLQTILNYSSGLCHLFRNVNAGILSEMYNHGCFDRGRPSREGSR